MRLYGKNPVLERVKVAPGTIKKIVLQKGVNLSELVRAMKDAGLNFESVEKDWFKQNAKGVHAQGVIAEVSEYEYTPFEDIAKECLDGETIPVFLDGVTDPQNLGSIIRTLACMGGFSVVLPEHDSAEVNETVLRVASGGENYVKVAQVTNISTVLGKIKDIDVIVAGAMAEEGTTFSEAEINKPLIVVIGSEGKGIRPGVQKHLDLRLSLPMEGANLSYNAAIATALFCNEVKRSLNAK